MADFQQDIVVTVVSTFVVMGASGWITQLVIMLEKEYIDSWYTSFAAGAVLISIPIAILFLFMQRYYVDGVSGAVKG